MFSNHKRFKSFLSGLFSPKIYIEDIPLPAPKFENKIAFIDGDQLALDLLKAYEKHIKPLNITTYFVAMGQKNSRPPKMLKKYPELKLKRLIGFSSKKEVTDKFIAMFIQKAISDGLDEIYVVSSDYDFIEIFKMALEINHEIQIKMTLIIPNPQGRLKNISENFNSSITTII